MSETATRQRAQADRISSTYATLRELIVRGRLAPGSRIIEADLAERLGVSRTPVRSALHRLQQEGYIVEVEGGRRARLMVAPLTAEDATELFELVGQIESLAGWNAARLEPALRKRLAGKMLAINRQLEGLARQKQRNLDRFHDLDCAFHQTYVDAAGGPRLRALHASVRPQADRYDWVYAAAFVDAIALSVKEHKAIIRQIEKGDPPAAERAIQDNWRSAAGRLAGAVETVGERGSW